MRLRAMTAGLLATSVLAGCGSDDDSTPSRSRGACPTDPFSVVVTVDQWGDIVGQLGGDCTTVTTIIKSSAADPHDYEPTPGDTATFEGARLVVLNGLEYDHWADKAIDALDTAPSVVDGGEIVGLREGDNPHLWYGPDYVRQIAGAITAELKQLAPDAASYFDRQQTAWQTAMKPYDEEIERIKAIAAGKIYAASEPVFDYLAEAVGMTRGTPPGYQNAARNESDPPPADVAEFEQSLKDETIDVLIYNTQTEGPIPAQLRAVADDAGVAVVEVSETVPPGTGSFVEWQVRQLKSLTAALAA